MPKAKTSRAAAKRFKKTGTGKISRKKAYSSHKFTAKTRKQKRNLKKTETLKGGDAKRIKRMLPG
jgi:large subunit ribosomal protein L35